MRIEKTILSNLLTNEKYARKALPFVIEEYFSEASEKIVFGKIKQFVTNYNDIPNCELLKVELNKDSTIPEKLFAETIECVDSLINEPTNEDWLVDQTEKFCQDRAIYNGIMKSINIIDGNDKDLDKGAIPEILTKALAVSFDDYIGHDFLDNAESRYEFYHRKDERIPFDIEYFNLITKGGLPRKTLNVFIAGTNVGKSLAMCHMAAANLLAGKNVLYITLEMAEERIAERIDANLLNVPLDEMEELPKDVFMKKITNLQKKTLGKLIIKEYPTASAGASHFRHLMNELALKKDFFPDIVYIDYINICCSSRIKMGTQASGNSYAFIKAIAEELRGLATEKNLPIVTATQLNRSGFSNSDPGLEDTAESFGLPATADFMCAIVTSEELEKLGQLMVKQLKNRYSNKTSCKRFVIGVDYSKMRLYDVEQGAQDGVMKEDSSVMSNTAFGQRQEEDDDQWKKKKSRKDFEKLFQG